VYKISNLLKITGGKYFMENNNINMLKAQTKHGKHGKINPYSLSQNTIYILETKNDYINGKITEEEAKSIILRQKLCGNII
jgi:hypothetical protein